MKRQVLQMEMKTALTVAQDRYEETKVFVAHSTASENRRLKWK